MDLCKKESQYIAITTSSAFACGIYYIATIINVVHKIKSINEKCVISAAYVGIYMHNLINIVHHETKLIKTSYASKVIIVPKTIFGK